MKIHWWNGEGVARPSCGAANVLVRHTHASPFAVTCKSCLNHMLSAAEADVDEAHKEWMAAIQRKRNIERHIKSLSDEVTI